jgi:hypothetical protein
MTKPENADEGFDSSVCSEYLVFASHHLVIATDEVLDLHRILRSPYQSGSQDRFGNYGEWIVARRPHYT